jgi:hypothetical protein
LVLAIGPHQLVRIEGALDRRLDDLKVGRQIEVAWSEQAVMTYVEDFVAGVFALDGLLLGHTLDAGQYRYRTLWNASAISVEQMARVGSPDPSAIMRRRQRTGTGGVGSR